MKAGNRYDMADPADLQGRIRCIVQIVIITQKQGPGKG